MEKDLCCEKTAAEQQAIGKILGHLEELLTHSGEVHYKKGHDLFYIGHLPYGFYVLKKGNVELSRTNMSGKKEIIGSQNDDKIIGLYHLITNTPYCATATAKTEVKTLFIPKTVVLEFLKQA